MPVGISSLEELGTSSVEYALGFGLGVALGRALGPLATTLEQEAYSADPSKALDPRDAARIVAQGLEQLGWGQSEAAASGVNAGKFQLLEESELHAPPVGELLELIRRDLAGGDLAAHALRKAQLEPQWDAALLALAERPLEPAEIAKAIHRNIMRGEGLLLVEPSATPGRVAIVPSSSLDPATEAAWSGIDHERLRILVGNAGLPPGIVQGLELLNRGAITEDDFSRLVGESNMRQEWADVLLALRRRLLTPVEYAEAALRAWITDDEAKAGAALSGMTDADADLLLKLRGRPLAVHQITTGLARGGKFEPLPGEMTDPFQVSVRHANLRPEFYDLALANRYTIPSYFILRAILQDGGMTEAEFADYGRQLGWPPDLADKAAKAVGTGSGAGGDKYVTKAQTQLWTALHKMYVDDAVPDAQATSDLEFLGVSPAAVPQVLATWGRERALVRRLLSPTEIRKAIGQPGRDQAWALERLKEIGYTDADAATFLAE